MYQSYFRFVGGGHTGFFAFVNAIVHTVMYLYYLLAACGPGVKKYLGWKRYFLFSDPLYKLKFLCRYLTKLQMLQFVCVMIHALLPMYFDCGYPKIMPQVILKGFFIRFWILSKGCIKKTRFFEI